MTPLLIIAGGWRWRLGGRWAAAAADDVAAGVAHARVMCCCAALDGYKVDDSSRQLQYVWCADEAASSLLLDRWSRRQVVVVEDYDALIMIVSLNEWWLLGSRQTHNRLLVNFWTRCLRWHGFGFCQRSTSYAAASISTSETATTARKNLPNHNRHLHLKPKTGVKLHQLEYQIPT